MKRYYVTRIGGVYGHTDELGIDDAKYLHFDGDLWVTSEETAMEIADKFVEKGSKEAIKHLKRCCRWFQGHKISFQKYIP